MSKRILIIEDEKVPRTLIERTINRLDESIEVTSVDSAAEGLFYFFTVPFDLIFLDILMPDIDGNDFITIVEKNIAAGHLKTPPNIVVQSSISSITELSALTAKECIQEVLRKPLRPEQIQSCIERYCL